MKKQILILTIFTLALIAGTSDVFGQIDAVNGSAPRGTACVDDALHPIAGNPYTYELVANRLLHTNIHIFLCLTPLATIPSLMPKMGQKQE